MYTTNTLQENIIMPLVYTLLKVHVYFNSLNINHTGIN